MPHKNNEKCSKSLSRQPTLYVNRFTSIGIFTLIIWIQTIVISIMTIQIMNSHQFAWQKETSTLSSGNSQPLLTRKLAIVIPFVDHQVDILLKNMQRWILGDFASPCKQNAGGIYSDRGNENVVVIVDLILYFHKDWLATKGLLSQIKQTLNQTITFESENYPPFSLSQCFHKIQFFSAKLSEEQDIYPEGASNMFFGLWKWKSFVGAYQAMFYMEPDNWPCKSGWIYKLIQESALTSTPTSIQGHIVETESFWMKGSIIRNNISVVSTYSFRDHMNGNAIYRWDKEGGNEGFLSYLNKVEILFREFGPTHFLSSYDIALYLVLQNRTWTTWSDYTSLRHKFIYTGMIQNMYRATVPIVHITDAFPNTYFVHGRNVIV